MGTLRIVMVSLTCPRTLPQATFAQVPRVDVVLYLDRFDGVAQHVFLKLAVGLSEAVMLPLVFRPGIDFEALQICIRRFCIDEDPPAYRAIAAPHTLVLVDLMEKLGSFRRINYILHGDEDRPLVAVRLLDHDRFNPVIPDAEIELSVRQSEPRPKQQACSCSNACSRKSCMDTR